MSFPTRIGQKCCSGKFSGFLREECSSIAAVISSERTSDQHVDFRIDRDHNILSRFSSASINSYSDWVLPSFNSMWISIAFLSTDACGASQLALDALRVSNQLAYKDFVDKLVPYCSSSALQSCSHGLFTSYSSHFSEELPYVFQYKVGKLPHSQQTNKLGIILPDTGLTFFTTTIRVCDKGAIKFVRYERISV